MTKKVWGFCYCNTRDTNVFFYSFIIRYAWAFSTNHFDGVFLANFIREKCFNIYFLFYHKSPISGKPFIFLSNRKKGEYESQSQYERRCLFPFLALIFVVVANFPKYFKMLIESGLQCNYLKLQNNGFCAGFHKL